jgi:hypothetical protein
MILFRGNCQMQFCAEAATAAGQAVSFASLASPSTMLASPGSVPPKLAAMVRAAGVEEYLHTRELADQFLPPPASPRPEALVVNLFHENRPLWLHDREGYVFYLDPAAREVSPVLTAWLDRDCRLIVANPATYLDRLADMLLRFRGALPGVPLIVAGRMSHYPGLGPSPDSYLEGWSDMCFGAGREFAAWVSDLPEAYFLDADRIMAGVAARSGEPVEALFPFLRLAKPGQTDAPPMRRDIEHAGGLWPALAGHIVRTAATGRVEYAPDEVVPEAWTRPFAPERLDQTSMVALLASGSNYKAARAVGQFLFRAQEDFTDLLVACAPNMPICHNLLHMVRAYAARRPNPDLAAWARVQAEKVATFTANGEAYRREYLRKLADMEEMSLARKTF